MRQIYGEKVIALTRGGLQTGRHPVFLFGDDNPYSDVSLGLQKSAEAIVPEGFAPEGKGRTLGVLFFSEPTGLSR